MKICVGFTTKTKKIERAIISRTSSDMNFDFCWNVFLHSKEGVTQGDPLAMIAYGVGVLPLIRVLRSDHPQVYQPWYSDDAGAGGTFRDIMAHFRDLQLKGPAQGYFTEPTQSILVVSEQNVPRASPFSWRSLK